MGAKKRKSMNVPESKVEISGFGARNYDLLLKFGSFGRYSRMLETAIAHIGIRPDDAILDLGCGTGHNDCLMAKYLSDAGKIVGLEIGEEMIEQFKRKCAGRFNVSLMRQRIEEALPFENEFDKAFISFVFHGFPDSEREKIARNVFKGLKPGGEFFILDFNEFDIHAQTWWFRIVFLKGECPLAHQYITVEWKKRLLGWGFDHFGDHFYFKKRIRLLKAVKAG